VSWPDRRPVARKIPAESEWHQNLIDEKIEKLIRRRYPRVPQPGTKVHASIPYMTVNRERRSCCLELHSPNRRIPSRHEHSWAGDEMFNNYKMHPSLSLLSGVGISEVLRKKLGLATNLLVWDRLLFGWRPAPLYAERMFLRAIEMSKRSHYDKTSAFAWQYIRLNLPSEI
jgi:hypothetical protein